MNSITLVPMPHTIHIQTGTFSVDYDTTIVLEESLDDTVFKTAKLLQQEIHKAVAILLPIKKVKRDAKHLRENNICFRVDDSISHKEAYRLSIREKIINIFASGSSGFLYGAATLIQLLEVNRGESCCVEIADEPSYENRGYMLDVTRGRVPKMSSLKTMVDRLALYKINQLQLNMESCFKFDGLEEIWSTTDPLTPEDILEIDEHCAARGIDLVPCIATFGHLYDLLRSDSFQKYGELDYGVGEPFTWHHKMKHHSVNVSNPETLKLITNILDQYLPCFRSKKINICCDETYDLGKGKSAFLAEKMSYGEMYVGYVNQLIEYLQKDGRQVMLWADIVLNHQESLLLLNPAVTCLNWHYYYNAKEETVKILADTNLKQYVCPSVSGYSRLVNAYDMSFENIREMAALGHKYHAQGFLNTDWGDTGHINMPSLSIPCMIYGAAQGWNVKDNRDADTIDKVISLVEYGDKEQRLVPLLRELSHQDIITFNDIVCFRDFKIYSLTYNGLYEKAKDNILKATEEQLLTASSACQNIITALKQNIVGCYETFQDEMSEFYLSARGVQLLQELALTIKAKEYNQPVAMIDPPLSLAVKLEYWMVDYSVAWRKVSRESELHRIKEFMTHICSILREWQDK